MPKYKKRDPEFTAVQFTGDNLQEVVDELGPTYTVVVRDLRTTEMPSVTLHRDKNTPAIAIIYAGEWAVLDRGTDALRILTDDRFQREFEPVKRAGRPPKGKEEKRRPSTQGPSGAVSRLD